MKFFYTFLAIAIISSSIYSKNDSSNFIQTEIHHATNNTIDKLDKNFFTYGEKLNKCTQNYDSEKCIERVRSELKQSIKDDVRALGTIITIDLVTIAAINVAKNTNLKETATAINTTRKTTLFLPAITTGIDATIKTLLYIMSRP
ncbi:hypothetical protein KBD08_03240 [Candidatus Babeliales bacterium]|nr:hypothetical protein [Candidatus Babeliales bacterium]